MKTPATARMEREVYLSKTAKQLFDKVDFADTFSTTNHAEDLPVITQKILTINNRWIIYLFTLRNWLVKIFGLKTDLPQDYKDSFEVGGYVGFFKIYEIHPNEVVLGANDSHLDFRLIVSNTHSIVYNIKATTLVQFNNRLGNIYMKIVAPFHRLVVKKMVAQAYNA